MGAQAVPKEDLVLLRFHKGAAPYITGDVAGFPRSVAEAYLKGKVARAVEAHEVPAILEAEQAASARSREEAKPHLVKFLRMWQVGVVVYRAGEIAGFSADIVKALERLGAAQEIDASEVPEQGPGNVVEFRRGPDGGAYVAPERPDLTSIRFVKGAPPYIAGDLAGFERDLAEEYVERGFAVFEDGRGAAGGPEPGDLPDPSTVDGGVEVLGLDDRDPDWREKAPSGPDADKQVKGGSKKGRG